MDADGEFISRAFPTLEKISSDPSRTFRALHTNCKGEKLYCVDSGSNVFVTEQIIVRGENLRDLEIPIEIETATPSGNLIVTQVYDVGELCAVRLWVQQPVYYRRRSPIIVGFQFY